VDATGVEEDTFSESGFATVNVCRDAYISDVGEGFTVFVCDSSDGRLWGGRGSKRIAVVDWG
jgi:hypothetical protein